MTATRKHSKQHSSVKGFLATYCFIAILLFLLTLFDNIFVMLLGRRATKGLR